MSDDPQFYRRDLAHWCRVADSLARDGYGDVAENIWKEVATARSVNMRQKAIWLSRDEQIIVEEAERRQGGSPRDTSTSRAVRA